VLQRESAELLALFSNPTVPAHSPLTLRPLALGQELKFLMRALPHEHLAVEPAASIEDVGAAVRAHNPRILLFSGHSFMGSLAFELADGRIDLPPPSAFIRQLTREAAPRLQCVFLNGCHTAALGHKLVEQLPWLYVICWCSITEDAAARAFATGFYDAVGDFIFSGESIGIELAYWLGLSKMYNEGFRLGDPAAFLHPPAHPHVPAPVFSGCDGCCPPVHGNVVLLASHAGQVHVLRPLSPDPPPKPPTPAARTGISLRRRSSLVQRCAGGPAADSPSGADEAMLTPTARSAASAAEASQPLSLRPVAPPPGPAAAAALGSSSSGSINRRRSTERLSAPGLAAAASTLSSSSTASMGCRRSTERLSAPGLAAAAATATLDWNISGSLSRHSLSLQETMLSCFSDRSRSLHEGSLSSGAVSARVAHSPAVAHSGGAVCAECAEPAACAPSGTSVAAAETAIEATLRKLTSSCNVCLLTQWHPVTPHDLIKQDVFDVRAIEPHAPTPAGPERRPSLFRRPSANLLGNPLARGSSALSRRASQALFGGKRKGGRYVGGTKCDATDELRGSPPHSVERPYIQNVYGSYDSLLTRVGIDPSLEASRTQPVLKHAASTPLPVAYADSPFGRPSCGSEEDAVQLAPLPPQGSPAPSTDADGAAALSAAAVVGSSPAGQGEASKSPLRSFGVTGGQTTTRRVGPQPQWHGAHDERRPHTAAGHDGARGDSITINIAAATACPTANANAHTARAAGSRPGTDMPGTLDGNLEPPSDLASEPQLPPRLSRVISFDANDSERRERLFRATAASRAPSTPSTLTCSGVPRESASQAVGQSKPLTPNGEGGRRAYTPWADGGGTGTPAREASGEILV